jgi:hypothetical protein
MIAETQALPAETYRRARVLFGVAALYDLLLGVVFFVLYDPIYDALGADLPENTGYIHLLAGFVFVQGLGYWLVYRNPVRNLDLVRVGAAYKAIFAGVAIGYAVFSELPDGIFLVFGILDVVFLAGFVWFIREAARAPRAAAA